MSLHLGFAEQVGATVVAKVPAVHKTVLVPEYPDAAHDNVQSSPLLTAEPEQELVYASFPLPPAAMLSVQSGVQQSEEAHVAPAQVTLKSELSVYPSSQELSAKSAPLVSMLSHVGFASQQTDEVQVPVRQSILAGESLRWLPLSHDSKPMHVGGATSVHFLSETPLK
jgi:hypothetical protein